MSNSVRPELVKAVRNELNELIRRNGRQLTWGEISFWRGFFCGRGVPIQEVDAAVAEMHEAEELPNLFDLIDDEDRALIEKRAAS